MLKNEERGTVAECNKSYTFERSVKGHGTKPHESQWKRKRGSLSPYNVNIGLALSSLAAKVPH